MVTSHRHCLTKFHAVWLDNMDVNVANISEWFTKGKDDCHVYCHFCKCSVPKEKEYSAEQSARVNKAYQALLHPMERGLYLLELHGKPLLEDEIDLPSDFLSYIMEVNEMIGECDSAGPLENLRHINDAKLQMLFSEVSLSFKEKNISKARQLICKLKYFINIEEKIKKLEEKFGVYRDD